MSVNYKPAGLDSDEEDSDEDYYGYDYEPRPRGAALSRIDPKDICHNIRIRDYSALADSITLFKNEKKSLDSDYSNREAPLIVACSYAWEEGVELLLKNGANPNFRKELMTPLRACCIGHVGEDQARGNCARMLLDCGADVNFRDDFGRTPLIVAAVAGLPSVINCLLQHPQIDLHASDPKGWTALFHAKFNGNDSVVESLLAAGLDPNIKTKNSVTFNEMEVPASEPVISSDMTVDELFSDSILQCSSVDKELEENSEEERAVKFLKNLVGMENCVSTVLLSAGSSLTTIPNASLFDLLEGDEDLLERLGVHFSFDRHRILQVVHSLHLMNMKSSALPRVALDHPIGLGFVGNVLCSYVQQLVLINGAIAYLRRRMNDYPPDVPKPHVHHLSDSLIRAYAQNVNLQQKLQSVLTKLNKIKTIEESPVDYKGHTTRTYRHSLKFKIFSLSAALFIAVGMGRLIQFVNFK